MSFKKFENSSELKKLDAEITTQIKSKHMEIDEVAESNQWRVLEAFRNHKVSESHLQGTTGYGYDDFGRETLEALYAEVFGAESGLVRPQLISGTHAITVALFGVLRPGDEFIYITGKPYDTLEGVIGLREGGHGTLKDFGIHCNTIPLKNGDIDIEQLFSKMSSKVKMLAIQRSRGYDERPSLTIEQIENAINKIKEIYPEVIVFVDNCYGEFVETKEPSHIGADLVAGSLIKNPGAGLVKVGGYIVGRTDLVDMCAERLTAPGLGREVGPTQNHLIDMYQGLFLAPHITSEALKGAIFTSAMMEKVGMETNPTWQQKRTDLVQSVTFNDPDKMVLFCQAIQASSPINGHVKPVPSPMPGYEDEVIMAAGTFVQGSSIELSADGPLRPPYIAFVQGGLTYSHVKYAILSAVDQLLENNLVAIH